MTGKNDVDESKKGKVLAKFGDDPLTVMAKQVGLEPIKLKKILKATIIRPLKADEASGTVEREATDEEVTVFLMVANKYHLDPILKEIYAFPDKKSGAIIPIVSTDGWNKLMMNNAKYKTHKYNFSEKIVTFGNAKPCPEWIECVVIRQDGSEVAVREYLDECYRSFKTPGPWQSHTKRMLRHKAKIQGAREALGFSGIYDKDEAERIMEQKEIDLVSEIGYKANAMMPKEKVAIGSGVIIDASVDGETEQEPPPHDDGEVGFEGYEDPTPRDDEDAQDPEPTDRGDEPQKPFVKGDPQLGKVKTDEELAAEEKAKNPNAGKVDDKAQSGKKKLVGMSSEFFNILMADLGRNRAMVSDQLLKYTGKTSFFDLSEENAKKAYDAYMTHGPKK